MDVIKLTPECDSENNLVQYGKFGQINTDTEECDINLDQADGGGGDDISQGPLRQMRQMSVLEEILKDASIPEDCGPEIDQLYSLKKPKRGTLSKLSALMKYKTKEKITHNAHSEGSFNPFSKLPPEIYFYIFKHLHQSDLLQCRRVSLLWSQITNAFIHLNLTLDPKKLRSSHKSLQYLKVNRVTFCDTTRRLKVRHFLALTCPRSVEFCGRISSRNFLKLTKIWRKIQDLSLSIESLNKKGLFRRWKHPYPLECFPELRRLDCRIDRYQLKKIANFSSRNIRNNLNEIFLNPYTHVKSFTIQMLNFGNLSPCSFISTALLFIGRQHKSLEEVEITFHTGLEYEIYPKPLEEIHQDSEELEHQLYVHSSWANFPNLSGLNLSKVEIHIPSIRGCCTEEESCNQAQELILAPGNRLKELVIETLHGIDSNLVRKIVTQNWLYLKEIDLTLSVQPPEGEDFFNLAIFSPCVSLKSLRLKKTGFPEVAQVALDSLTGFAALPKSIEKISLIKFHLHMKTLPLIANYLPRLQCLMISLCSHYMAFVSTEKMDLALPEIFTLLFTQNPSLKYINYSSLDLTYNQTMNLLENDLEIIKLMQDVGWQYDVVHNPFLLYKPKQIVLFKELEDAQKQWFPPLIYEKVKI